MRSLKLLYVIFLMLIVNYIDCIGFQIQNPKCSLTHLAYIINIIIASILIYYRYC